MTDFTKIPPIIPKYLAHKHPTTWSPENVLAFLKVNKEKYYLYDEDIKRIQDNRVAGLAFIELTEEKLLKEPYKLPGGPATVIEKLVKKLLLIAAHVHEAADDTPQVVSDRSLRHYTRRQKTSSLTLQQQQNLAIFNEMLKLELYNVVYKDVKGLHPHLFENIDPTKVDSYDLPRPGNFADRPPNSSPTLSSGDIFERNVTDWLAEFSYAVTKNTSTSRFFYPSGSLSLLDTHLKGIRKPDVVLTRKLDDEKSHKSALNNKFKQSCYDILVIGEIKSAAKDDAISDTVVQLASYVRETLSAQPFRRFVHGFTVCGHWARFWLFDRLGVSVSCSFDIHSEDGCRSFMHGLLSYMTMSPFELGFDDRYLDSAGNTFLPGSTLPAMTKELFPISLCLPGIDGRNQKFRLRKMLSHTASIASRGTLCWEAEDSDHQLYVIKSAWRDDALQPEAQYWQVAKREGCLGCLDIASALDSDIVSMTSQASNNIRRLFDYSEARVIELRVNENPTLESISENSYELVKEEQFGTSRGSKRKSVGQDFHTSKKSKTMPNPLKLQAPLMRTHSFMATRTVGIPLSPSFTPLALVETIRDAIQCHRSLYEKAHILHCDISLSNIMMTRPEDRAAMGVAGMLIDLDFAQFVKPTESDESDLSTSSCGKTGTPPFVAIDLLLTPERTNTWRHDLESFFYVLIWLCYPNPDKQLQEWSGAASGDVKLRQVALQFDTLVKSFRRECAPLSGLVRGFRKALFVDRAEGIAAYIGTPHESERGKVYDAILAEFDQCIVELRRQEEEKAENTAGG